MPDQRITIGNVEIESLSDGRLEFPVGEFFPKVPSESWDPYLGQLSSGRKLVMNVGSFLLRSEGKTVLVDTGLGQSHRGFRDAVSGLLLDGMRDKGVRPDEVDLVLITHLHQDHVGWNFMEEDGVSRPTFPNARYWIPKADWDAYTRRASGRLAYIQEKVLPLEELGLLEPIEGERALTSEITSLPTPGHTPGHTSVLVSSEGQRGVILGDVVHHPAQVHHTDWSPRADINPDKATATRRAMMDRLEGEAAMLIAGHFPVPGFGRLVRLEGRRYWQAV